MVDISDNYQGNTFQKAQEFLEGFIENFMEEKDRMSLVVYGAQAIVLQNLLKVKESQQLT